MSARKTYARGGFVDGPRLADFGYVIPAHEITAQGPIITAEQMRMQKLVNESLERLRAQISAEPEPKPKGRRADTRVSYMDVWAKRYWRSQAGVERDRLKKGKARHRAHRNELPIKSPNGDDE